MAAVATIVESLTVQTGPEEDVEWTDECNELIGQVLETQGEIASLLKTHNDNTESLVQLKKQCDEELVDLQEDAWKLQMLVELQRMGQQLERLASQDEADLAAKQTDCADKATQDTADRRSSSSTESHEAELQDLDKEIAELDAQLVAARAELKGLLQDKVALEDNAMLAGQQLQSLAMVESSALAMQEPPEGA